MRLSWLLDDESQAVGTDFAALGRLAGDLEIALFLVGFESVGHGVTWWFQW
jgi:hypothetical protein